MWLWSYCLLQLCLISDGGCTRGCTPDFSINTPYPQFIRAQRQILISLPTSGPIIKDWVCLWLKNRLLFFCVCLCASFKLASVKSRELNRPWTQLCIYLLSPESWKVCRKPHSIFNLRFYKKIPSGSWNQPSHVCSWCTFTFRSLAEESFTRK